MFRQYENARKLEKELEEWLANHPKDEWDIDDFEEYCELKERISFAYQDEEYDENYCL